MKNRTSMTAHRILLSALLATLLVGGASSSALATGTSDAELRGYKGGLVEIGLKNGKTVRGLLYAYTAGHLELEVAGDRTVKLHRSWVASLKAAPAGSKKSALGEFPLNAGEGYRTAPPREPETPTETPRRTTGAETTPPPGRPARPAATAPPEKATGGPRQRGLVFQLKIGGNLLTFFENSISSWLNSSFMFGYKIGRLVVGLGLEMSYSDDNMPNLDPEPTESSAALVLFQPTVEYYLAIKSSLAIYLSVGLHVGFVNAHADPGEDVTDPMIGFHTGLGMRFFFHPRFAVGLEGGLRGVWLMIENDEDMDEDDNHTGVMSLYGAATLTAIW